MNEYAGESLAKKVARVRLYRHARRFLRFKGIRPEDRRVVFLPGPDASEVGALKYILEVSSENAFAVDRDPKAIEMVQTRWPGVLVACGDLEDSKIASQVAADSCAFVHMDLMGNLTNTVESIYALWSNVVRRGGVFATTYLRGREKSGSLGKYIADLLRPAHTPYQKRTTLLNADSLRAHSHNIVLNEAWLRYSMVSRSMDENDESLCAHFWAHYCDRFVPCSAHTYRSEQSPMGVVASVRVKPAVFRNSDGSGTDFFALIRKKHRDATSVIKKDPMDDLLAEADALQKEFSREQVAEILDVTPGTLAAWRAHRTMGTYA